MCSLLFCDPLQTEDKNHVPGTGISVEGFTARPETLPPGYILDMYIYEFLFLMIQQY